MLFGFKSGDEMSAEEKFKMSRRIEKKFFRLHDALMKRGEIGERELDMFIDRVPGDFWDDPEVVIIWNERFRQKIKALARICLVEDQERGEEYLFLLFECEGRNKKGLPMTMLYIPLESLDSETVKVIAIANNGKACSAPIIIDGGNILFVSRGGEGDGAYRIFYNGSDKMATLLHTPNEDFLSVKETFLRFFQHVDKKLTDPVLDEKSWEKQWLPLPVRSRLSIQTRNYGVVEAYLSETGNVYLKLPG